MQSKMAMICRLDGAIVVADNQSLDSVRKAIFRILSSGAQAALPLVQMDGEQG